MPNRKWTKARRDKYMATMERKRQAIVSAAVDCREPFKNVPNSPFALSEGMERMEGMKRNANGAHPNAELIGKVLDVLMNPQTHDKVAERLFIVLDRLMACDA